MAEEAKTKKFDGLLAKKLGMTQIYDESGKVFPVTVLEAGPCVVVKKLTKEKEGYVALQLGFDNRRKVNKPLAGIQKFLGRETFFRYIKEIRSDESANFEPGEIISANIFTEGDRVDLIGDSIGKGFMGTVRRHHFGRGDMTHGSKNHRNPGSSGAGTTPGRVVPGKRMAGRMGGERITQPSRIVKVDKENNLIMVAGGVPGKEGNLIILRRT